MSMCRAFAREISAVIGSLEQSASQQENPMPRTPDECALALECLKLAVSAPAATIGGDPVVDAEHFYAFVTGTEGGSARDKINAALDEAGVI